MVFPVLQSRLLIAEALEKPHAVFKREIGSIIKKRKYSTKVKKINRVNYKIVPKKIILKN